MSEIKAPARNPSELSLAALQKGAELHGAAIKFAKNMTAEKAADILTKHLEADYGADNLVACATCGYGSTESDATCPFCGMAFTSDPPADIETILTPAVVPANEPPPVEVEPAKRGRGRPKGSGKKAPPSPRPAARRRQEENQHGQAAGRGNRCHERDDRTFRFARRSDQTTVREHHGAQL